MYAQRADKLSNRVSIYNEFRDENITLSHLIGVLEEMDSTKTEEPPKVVDNVRKRLLYTLKQLMDIEENYADKQIENRNKDFKAVTEEEVLSEGSSIQTETSTPVETSTPTQPEQTKPESTTEEVDKMISDYKEDLINGLKEQMNKLSTEARSIVGIEIRLQSEEYQKLKDQPIDEYGVNEYTMLKGQYDSALEKYSEDKARMDEIEFLRKTVSTIKAIRSAKTTEEVKSIMNKYNLDSANVIPLSDKQNENITRLPEGTF
jgi:hypothetical protein